MDDGREPIALAIDIGGTFTDLAAVDRRDGSLILSKVATTPSRLQQGVLSALERSGALAGRRGRVRPRQHRRDQRRHRTPRSTDRARDDGGLPRRARDRPGEPPRPVQPLVPQAGTVRAHGGCGSRCPSGSRTPATVLVPLDEAAVESVAERLRALDVEAVAICFLHAWTNPEHERRAAELLSKLLRGVEIVASHEISSQWREFERTSTTVLSAYVKPTVASYLDELRSGLRGRRRRRHPCTRCGRAAASRRSNARPRRPSRCSSPAPSPG